MFLKISKSQLAAGLGVISLMISQIAGSATERQTMIDQNLAPIGQVNVAGAAAAAANAAPAAPDGAAIYNKVCVACHASGVSGAPIVGDKAKWAPRIALGVDALTTAALKGINAMPPKGGCMSCTDEEIKLAVEYMVKQSS